MTARAGSPARSFVHVIGWLLLVMHVAPGLAAAQVDAVPAQFAAAEQLLEGSCAACHGEGGVGGDRAPPLVESARLRAMDDAQLLAVIRGGTGGGMPSFALPDPALRQLVAYLRSRNASAVRSAPPEQLAAGERVFFGPGRCAACHMVRGRGGVNGPDLSDVAVRSSYAEIVAMLDAPNTRIGMRTTSWCPGWAFCPDLQWSVVTVRTAAGPLRGFARNQGEHDLQLQTFDGKLRLLTERDYSGVTRDAVSYMPPFAGSATERRDLLAYLQSLDGVAPGPLLRSTATATATATATETATATAIPSRSPAAAARAAEKEGDWPTYDGHPRGNRYSALARIDVHNVARLQAQWVFTPGGAGLQTTPVVVDGVMYVTGAARVCALDARNGRTVWCAPRVSGQPVAAPETPAAGARPDAAAGAQAPFGNLSKASGPNRGVAVSGDRVFFVSDDAYLVCLNRITGAVMWLQALPDPAYRGRYYNSAAPLVVGDLVISGVAGGDSPLRGFLAAYRVDTGELAWRFWTIPAAGEPGSETWPANALPTGGGATWTTGSYDAEAGLLYWAVGNPFPDTNGAVREGANLYSNSVVALDPQSGKPRWWYQFTPHDVHDWDANAPLVLVDAQYDGRPRKLLMQANRNGFFYELDRLSGEFLRARPFVKKLTWASEVGADGVPKLLPGNEPTPAGTLTCPSVRGATNWYATAYHAGTGLFYVMAAEDCSVYRPEGAIFSGYRNPQDPGLRYLRALDPSSGRVVWEKPMVGAQEANYGGVLATAGGLVFHGETGGRFAAVDARTGATLWSFPANEFPRASPMTYMVDGRQYVAVAAGGNVIAFALPD